MAEIRGGEKLAAKLREFAELARNPASLRVGFLQGATYPNGTPVAMIAAIHNFGAPRAGIPPRPFFDHLIENKGPEWPEAIGNLLVANNYDAEKTLQITGSAIEGQLKKSIIDTNEPPLAESTIRRKGFDKPLIDTSHMINSTGFVVNKT